MYSTYEISLMFIIILYCILIVIMVGNAYCVS